MIPRLSAAQSVLLIIDMQQTLMPVIHDAQTQIATVGRLAQAARLLGIPVLATEHVAHKLGHTVAPLSGYIDRVHHKATFDACAEKAFFETVPHNRQQVVVVGAEAHVCVMQTALGLLAARHEVWFVSDGCGSRHDSDKQAAGTRLSQSGAMAVTAEMVMFEWLAGPSHPAFREVLGLIKSRDGKCD